MHAKTNKTISGPDGFYKGIIMSQTELEYLPHSSGCFLCGDENRCGARTRFFVREDTVRTKLILPQHHNGYKDLAHGGILAGLLDETMGWAATVFSRDHLFYVTGALTVKYILPVPVKQEIEIIGHLIKDAGRIAYCQGELLDNGKVCLRAKGKFLPLTPEATNEVIGYLKFDQCRRYRTLFGRVKGETP
jgi:acyl-coenzyme A thioesterase PaaI-like protein